MSLDNPPNLKKGGSRLALRASVLYLGLPALALVVLLVISLFMFDALADDSAQRLARQYSIEAAANFMAGANQHLTLMQQVSRSTTISRWLANEHDLENMARALDEINGYAAFVQGVYIMFTVYESLSGYNFELDMALEDFVSWGQVIYGSIASQWFFDTRDAELPFILNIQRTRPDEDGNWELYIWSNHRMYYRGAFVGVVTVGTPFEEVFHATFYAFDAINRRGYVIDRNAAVRADSAMLLQVLDDGLPNFPRIPEADINPGFVESLASHIGLMEGGMFLPGAGTHAATRIAGQYRFASIAPIVGTDWSVVVLSNYVGVLDGERYAPLIFSALLALVVSFIVGSLVVRRAVLFPLRRLKESATEAASVTTSASLFGLDRRDEIGDLARTVQHMRESLKNALEDMKRIELVAETQRREIAEEESRAKSRFLARMSHEIRTPMNAVLGIAEIELQKESHLPQTEEAFQHIHRSARMLLSIINDILDLSRVESGKMEVVPAVYDTEAFIADAVHLNLIQKGSKKLDFELSVDEALPARMEGDELRIKQIMNNLLSNAFKYTEKGVVSLSFWAEEAGEEGSVILAIGVSDTGQGMTGEQIETLFGDEFIRFNMQNNRAIEGSGLGMSITSSFIRMMGGELKVESEPGKGSLFTVRVPQKIRSGKVLGPETAERLQKLQGVKNEPLKAAKFALEPMPHGRVLVVDDVDINLYVAEGILASYEISVDTAQSGQEAIDKIKGGETYDIIFMDHMMPGMDGMETTKAIRGMGYGGPVVALTANALKDTAKMFMDNGFSGFISKPIDIDKLNAYLARFIRDKRPAESQAELVATLG